MSPSDLSVYPVSLRYPMRLSTFAYSTFGILGSKKFTLLNHSGSPSLSHGASPMSIAYSTKFGKNPRARSQRVTSLTSLSHAYRQENVIAFGGTELAAYAVILIIVHGLRSIIAGYVRPTMPV